MDFKPLYEAHKRQMVSAGCDVDRLIEVRHEMHANAEGAFEEHWTHKKIRDTLLSFEGFKESDMKVCAKTGLVVDIKGTDWTGPASKQTGGVKTVAIRADMDGLPIPENNPELPYKTKTDWAHMCGHDGHMAMLLAAA